MRWPIHCQAQWIYRVESKHTPVKLRGLLFLLLVPLAIAAPTGEQTAVSTEDIVAFDVGGEFLLGAWDDERSELSATTPVNTWSVWQDGKRVRTGTTANPDCNSFVTCKTTIEGVFVSPQRFVIASTDGGLGSTGRLIAGTHTQGITQRLQVATIHAFAASEDGSKFAIIDRSFQGDYTLKAYNWVGDSPGSLQLQWSKTLNAAPTILVIGDSGHGAIALGEKDHIRFTSLGVLRQRTLESQVNALEYGDDSWSLAGLKDGRVLVFGPDSNTAPFAPEIELHPFDDAINAVAWASPESFIVGDAGGRLTSYWNTEVVSVTDEVRWRSTNSAIRDIAANDDYFIAINNNGAVFGDPNGTLIWSDPLTGSAVALGASGYAAMQTPTGLIPLASVHSVKATIPDFVVQTGGSTTEMVRIENAGNRAQTVELDFFLNQNWFGNLATSVDLLPNEIVEVPFRLTSSATVGAGNSTGVVTISGPNLSPQEITVNILVPGETNWDLVSDSADVIGANPGETVEFAFKVENNGNEPLVPQLNATSLSDWPNELSYDNTAMPARSSITGNLSIRVPDNAQEGAEAVYFVSIAGDVLEFKVIVGAFYGVDAEFISLFQKIPAGTSQQLTLQVKNTGNGLDGYRFQLTGIPNDWNVTFDRNILLAINPGQSVTLAVEVEIPRTAVPQNYQSTATVTSLGDTRFTDSEKILFPVVEPLPVSTSSTESKESPAPLGILLLLAAVLARKRHT